MPQNQFHIWRLSQSQPATFSPRDEANTPEPSDIRYHAGVLHALDQLMPDAGMTFLLTWHLDRFDERLRDAVVLLIGDECYQTPSYASQVRAIFKTGGVKRNSLAQTFHLPWSVAWRNAMRDARNDLKALKRHIDRGRTPIYEIPLGYHTLVDVPEVPFDERPIDVFFAGSLAPAMKPELRPSIASRRQMMRAIDIAQVAFSDRKMDCSLQPLTRKFAPADYSRNLMNTKIVLCPRGNFDETFRFFEAARSGCVIITEPLPNRWYYEGAPVVQIRAWSELSAKLRELFADPARLSELSRRTQNWWEIKASEPAVAQYVASQLAMDR
jgi:hypothetical protein